MDTSKWPCTCGMTVPTCTSVTTVSDIWVVKNTRWFMLTVCLLMSWWVLIINHIVMKGSGSSPTQYSWNSVLWCFSLHKQDVRYHLLKLGIPETFTVHPKKTCLLLLGSTSYHLQTETTPFWHTQSHCLQNQVQPMQTLGSPASEDVIIGAQTEDPSTSSQL